MQEVIGVTERRERRTTLMMELRVKIILQGVRKPPHWFSIQTLDDTGWHCTWPLACWFTQLSAWEIRWCEISELTVGFLIRVKFSIEELFSSYVFIKHWHSDTTLWQLHRITRWLPLLPPPSTETRNDLWHQHQQYYSNGRFFLSSVHCFILCAWMLKEAFSFYLTGKFLLSCGGWFST